MILQQQVQNLLLNLEASFGVKADPLGAYTGEITADLSSDFSSSITLDNLSTGSYNVMIKLDGVFQYSKTVAAAKTWKNTEKVRNASFTCGTLDGSINSPGCHTCSQRAGLAGTRTAKVNNAIYTIDITNFGSSRKCVQSYK